MTNGRSDLSAQRNLCRRSQENPSVPIVEGCDQPNKTRQHRLRIATATTRTSASSCEPPSRDYTHSGCQDEDHVCEIKTCSALNLNDCPATAPDGKSPATMHKFRLPLAIAMRFWTSHWKRQPNHMHPTLRDIQAESLVVAQFVTGPEGLELEPRDHEGRTHLQDGQLECLAV